MVKPVTVERTLLLACLGLVNSTKFSDDREDVRVSVVRELHATLGFRLVGTPPLRPIHRAADMLPGSHPNDQ